VPVLDEKSLLNPRVSVVVPVYRSAATLRQLLSEVTVILSTRYAWYEVILVEDRSPDNSWEILKALKQEYGEHVKIVRLLRNSGQHNAILCGFTIASGQVVVTMDDDLQNPPEEIPKLVTAVEAGFDLAIGAYDIKQHGGWRNLSGGVIDRLQRRMFKLPADFQLTSFRAVRSEVIKNVCEMSGAFPYITAMLLSHTSNCTNVAVDHEPRMVGKSNYNLVRSVRLAANLVLNYSSYPVYMVAIAAAVSLLFSVVYSLVVVYQSIVDGTSVPGWASTVVILSFFNSILMFCMMVFGLYLSRLVRQVSRTRVSFTVSEIQE